LLQESKENAHKGSVAKHGMSVTTKTGGTISCTVRVQSFSQGDDTYFIAVLSRDASGGQLPSL